MARRQEATGVREGLRACGWGLREIRGNREIKEFKEIKEIKERSAF